ncbi:MAG: T9SS type A sorting domain-containing protein [Bacteroidota bacterium]|nr:T9SS type A sorting domain-containing protein [Bacteroidota bacterium]
MKTLYLIIISAFITTISFAQYPVQVGTLQGASSVELPYNNQYDYNWCTTIYPKEEIMAHGDIVKITYELSSFQTSPDVALNQRVYMATTNNIEFSDAGYPDVNSMTFVYDGTIMYEVIQVAGFTEINLTTPFNYDNTENLIIHIENRDETASGHDLFTDYADVNYLNICKHNQQDGSFPTGNGTLISEMPIVYLGFDSGLDVGINDLSQNNILPGINDLSLNFRNYMGDTITSCNIEWELDGVPQTTINWNGTVYTGQISNDILLLDDYDFAPGTYQIKAWTSNPNEGTDSFNNNDTLTKTILVADYIEIGDNVSNSTNGIINKYSWFSSIYKEDSIISGKICGIAFNNLTQGNNRANQTIYLKQTTDNIYSTNNLPNENLFNKVYSGNYDMSNGNGWKKLSFDTIFNYNDNNLVVHYRNNSAWNYTPTAFKASDYINGITIRADDNSSLPTIGSSSTRAADIRLYYLIPIDAGVTEVETPSYVNIGNNDIKVSLKNFGTDIITSAEINYKIDNGTIHTFNWTGSLVCYGTEPDIIIGNESYTYGEHTIKIWTDLPNGLNDYKNENDTLVKTIYATNPLCGTYVVGSAPSDYATLKEAVDSLNSCGISCDVIFDIKSGIYTSQYQIDSVNYATIPYSVTFQSQTGDSTDVILTTDSTDYLFNLNGADYLRFNHLTFTSDSAEKFIILDTNACNNTFSGNAFSSDTSLSTYIYSGVYNDSSFVVQNNRFVNGNNAIYLRGNTETEQSTIIDNNIFNNQNSNSIYIEYSNKASILNNIINSPSNGIYLKESTNININANDIRLSEAENGIFFDHCLGDTENRNFITNNFISGNISYAWNHSGIGLFYSSSFTNVYYNSINITGTEQAVYLYTTDNINLKNNIIINKNNNPIKVQSLTSLNSDFNCFYSDNNSFDLSTCQSATGLDVNSIFAVPSFIGNTDLHTNSIFVDNAGTPLALITDDIDGEPRNITTPDIGADEFTSSCNGPLSGNYTIGTTGDYSSFDNALQTLLDCGMDSSIVFNVETGNYDEQLNIDGYYISSDSSAWTITFQSQSGDSTDVVLQYDADSLNNYVVKLKTIENLIFKNMTFKALDTSFARVIVFEDLIKNIVVSNNQIIGSHTISDDNQIACIYSDNLNEIDTMSINFNNNYIVDGSYGIDFDFGWSGDVKNNFISSYNKFYNQSYAGIYLNGVSNIQIIKNNTIESYNNPNYGIYSSGIDSLNISSNIISLSSSESNCYGIENFSSHNIIANNFISLKAIQNAHVYGYYSSSFSILYNNTVFCYGDGNYYSSPVTVSASTSIITNNNLVNLITERVIYSLYTITSDYNNLYSNSSYFDFNDWQISTGMDSNSVSFMPDFVSGTDLHTNSALLYQTGIAIPEITTDIDGETRNNPPCIGADEFDNPVFNAGNDTVFCYYNQYFQENSYVYDIGLGYDSYQWSTGSDSSSISIDTLTSVGNNSYTVTVTIGTNTYSDTINILYDKPEPISNIEYCAATNDSILITANQYNYYLWNNGDTTQSIYGFPYYGYNIIVTDNYGCTAKSPTFYVENNQYPALLPDDTVICCNQSVELVANNYNESDLYNKFDFIWNTGDTTHTLIVDSIHYGIGIHTFIVSVVNKASVFNCESKDTINIEIQDCIGIDEYSNDNIIKIYPNPATNNLTINSEKLLINNIEILDITGKLVLTPLLQKTSTTQTFDINRLKKGLYFIKIRTNNFTNVLKFIKK